MSHAPDTLRTELAATAARLIAEEGCDYSQAKRRAVHEVLGPGGAGQGQLPDNGEVERELRRYLSVFFADTHPALLAALRRVAVDVMARLEAFNPHLVGAVLNGTATEHSDIELHLFTDSAKDVEVCLMNAGIEFDIEQGEAGDRPAVQERLTFVVAPHDQHLTARASRVGVRLHVFERDAIRVAPRHRTPPTAEFDIHPVAASGRATLAAVRRLLEESA